MDNLYRKHKLGIELVMSQGQLGTEESDSKISKKLTKFTAHFK